MYKLVNLQAITKVLESNSAYVLEIYKRKAKSAKHVIGIL